MYWQKSTFRLKQNLQKSHNFLLSRQRVQRPFLKPAFLPPEGQSPPVTRYDGVGGVPAVSSGRHDFALHRPGRRVQTA